MKDIVFEQTAFDDLTFWVKTDIRIAKKILQLIENITKTPYTGIGKPEALKHQLQGYWSKRIDDEHRLIYRVEVTSIVIVACRYHYS